MKNSDLYGKSTYYEIKEYYENNKERLQERAGNKYR